MNYKKIIIVGVAFLLMLVIVPTIVYFIMNPGEKSIIENSNSEKVQQISSEDLEQVQGKIKIILKNNYDLSDADLSNLGVVIRENSINFDDEDGTFSLLADLSSPELTYEIEKSPGGDILVNCPTVAEMKNPEVFCIGEEKTSTIDVVLGNELPYSNETDSGYYYIVRKDYGENSNPRLAIYAPESCDSEDASREIKSAVKSWISSHGINAEIIPLIYDSVSCDVE